MDPDLLRAYIAQSERLVAIHAQTSGITRGTVHDRVNSRLANARLGTQLQVMTMEEFKSAPLQDPPISTGMTETLTKLKNILTRPQAIDEREYVQVPVLLRRVRHLLRVYYDAKVTGKRPPEFRFCDAEEISSVGLDLHECGLTLQYMPGRLRALFRATDEMDKFLLDEPLDLGKWRMDAFARSEAVEADPESTDDDRFAVADIEENAGDDLAAFQMVYFVGDVLVSWLLIKPLTELERRRATRAMERLVEYSSAPIYRKSQALGDPLTDAMMPVYTNKSLLVRFAQAGGLPAVFDDWATAAGKDGYIQTAVEVMPKDAWLNQTPQSLLGAMRGMLKKIEVEGESIVETQLFARFIHEIYSRYGLAPFENAISISAQAHEIFFYFLHRRMSRKPELYRQYSAIRTLLKKYTHVPRTTRRRHGWMILTVSGRWDCITLYGCGNPECPEKQELLKLRDQRKRGIRDPVVEERLYRWGGESKACTNCRDVSYCSSTCQRAHWKQHKVKCQAQTAQDKNAMEVEI